MMKIGFALAVASIAVLGTTTASLAFDNDDHDTGWGARYNSHLDPYNGRPLGPPLASLPPGYQYYNGRLIWVPDPGSSYVPYRGSGYAARLGRIPARSSAARRR